MNENKSAVLFIVFNRPHCTRQVFDAIRRYRPARLYVAADGPRENVPADIANCTEVRSIAGDIDWEGTLHTLYQPVNRGMKAAEIAALDWFFEQEEEGIILEDDCLPAECFFRYCTTLLEKYRYDERVMHIGGSNLQFGRQRGNASYYFSSIPSVWGWAGWRRVWKLYDKEMKLFSLFDKQQLMSYFFPDEATAQFATQLLRAVQDKKISTWDFQLGFTVLVNNGLCAIPNKNLVSNIGFAPGSTSTKNPNDIHAHIPLEELTTISHPEFFIADRQADQYQLSLSMPPKPVPAVKTPFVKKLFGAK